MTRDDSDVTENIDAADDPTRIRSIAVTGDDVVAALEARRRKGVPAVLRVTPPFAGRMRARLHVAGGEGNYGDYGETTAPIHLGPERLVAAVPPFPDPDDTEDRLRAAGEYSVDAHRTEHEAAVQRWRETAKEAVVDAVALELDEGEGSHEIAVKRLGRG
ncbi:hypothetical protein AUR64_04825 [Haloprofundus marisrubri]|uniref:DUF8009 domain-containing protein n=1 Tax=Haloprofundus marisrubri TaxID=1514971 RepID=A0A0W1RCX2_9EURY|nr:hypothetical protein [Haloprofundus marisrubri]KTG11252.1 hypothetical protein AUR64_04825 [Haloprofundus marisrubri]